MLETDVPLSQSVIWRMQREFYVQRGVKAWTEDMIPQFITNNPFIAEIYAGMVLSFLGDCKGPAASPEKPLRIFELGAGVGKFSYLLLRQLSSLLRARGMVPATVRYCMTDCSESMIQHWRDNRDLAEFVSCGMLEFERFQVGEEIDSRFLSSRGPLVLIANYVFDSLPQDAFEVKDGKMFETLVSTTKPAQSEGAGTITLSQLQLSYKNVAPGPQRYSDEAWNRILELYRSHLAKGTVLFPCAALEMLAKARNFSDGRMLVLVADKGFAHEEEMALCQGPPTIEFHGANCFSQMVNLHAVGKYFQAIAGESLLPDKHSTSLNICGFLEGRPDDQFAATKAAYVEAQAAFGPDDLFTLFAWLNVHMEEMTVAQILAALRLSRWDPILLLRVFPVLARQIRTVAAERYDLRNAMLKTWANHYPVSQSENALAFDCGVILLELHFFEDAVSMLKISQQILGPSAATSYNLGLCSLGLGWNREALACMVEACELDPRFEPARLSRERLEQESSNQHAAVSIQPKKHLSG
ncbi:MAG TPA: SAM-dependent methyltransferase [Candidatus Angelobacter sp.]